MTASATKGHSSIGALLAVWSERDGDPEAWAAATCRCSNGSSGPAHEPSTSAARKARQAARASGPLRAPRGGDRMFETWMWRAPPASARSGSGRRACPLHRPERPMRRLRALRRAAATAGFAPPRPAATQPPACGRSPQAWRSETDLQRDACGDRFRHDDVCGFLLIDGGRPSLGDRTVRAKHMQAPASRSRTA